MHFIDMDFVHYVPESYSRQIDERVARQEMPYGYTNSPPPADTGDFDQAKLECSYAGQRSKGGKRGY